MTHEQGGVSTDVTAPSQTGPPPPGGERVEEGWSTGLAQREWAVRAAVVAVLLTWIPMLALALVQGVAFGHRVAIPFVRDLDAAARFLLAVPLLLLVQPLAFARWADTEQEFPYAGLVPPAALPAYHALVADANRRMESRGAATVLFIVAYLLAVPAVLMTEPTVPNWRFFGPSGRDLSLAGWWYILVATPLFRFVLLRWLWRFGVWAQFLARVSRLPLTVVATHSDEAGGLAFVGRTQLVFGVVAVAIGAVFSADVGELVLYEGGSITQHTLLIAALVVLGTVVPAAPLAVFAPKLLRARRHTFLEHGALVSRHDLAFDSKWLSRRPPSGEAMLGNPDVASLAHVGAGFEHVMKMSALPIDPVTRLGFVIAALLPFLPLAFLKLSVAQVGERLLKLVL